MPYRTPHAARRICIIVPGFPADESDWFTPAVTQTILALKERYDIYVVSLQYPETRADYRLQDIPVSAAGSGGFSSVTYSIARITDEHRRKPFDLIHAFWATLAGVTGALASWKLNVPLIVTCAGGELVDRKDLSYGDWRSFMASAYVRASLRKADRIIAGSEYQKALINERDASWGARTVSVPLGIDTRRFHPGEPHKNEHGFKLLHVAGLVPIKNQQLLMKALTRIKDRSWHLEIVGDGPLKEKLQTLSRTLGIDDRITWQGWVHHDEIVARYHQADLFVLTSEHEAQGVVLLEAMACGLPVVATNVGLASELIDPASGACVARGDEEGLANAIAACIDTPEDRRDTGLRNRQTAERYNMELMVERLGEVYEQVVLENE